VQVVAPSAVIGECETATGRQEWFCVAEAEGTPIVARVPVSEVRAGGEVMLVLGPDMASSEMMMRLVLCISKQP